MGRVDPLHVRADIDETDAWRVHPESRHRPAAGQPRNFRVDTRVLQVIYAFAPKDFPAFAGQQVDVFIEAPARQKSLIVNRMPGGAIQ
jgi:hypothetical protein